MLGTLVNTVAVIVGSLIGIIFKKGVPERFTEAVMQVIGLCVAYVGISGSLKGENTLVLIVSMVIGTIIGTFVDIDGFINRVGDKLNSKIGNDGKTSVAQGFVTASLMFCVGAMAIVGSLNSGLGLGNETIYTKSLLDFISAIILSVSMGIGVMFSSVFVFLYQGSIVLLAGVLKPILTDFAISEITCAGSLMILAIGLNMMGISKIKVANLLPTIIIVPVICYIVQLF